MARLPRLLGPLEHPHASNRDTPALRLRSAIVAVAALLAAACGDGETDPEPNRSPVASETISAQTVAVGESVTVNVASAFSDQDGDALTYAATSSAPGVASVAVSGADVTVTGVSAGTASVTVTASDPDGLSAEQAFEVTVPNRAPVATDSIPAQTVEVGDSVSVDLAGHFSDPDGDALTYAATSSAPGVASVAVSGADVTVTGVSAGTASVTVAASDPDGLSAEQAFEVTVPNRTPVATDSIPAQTVEVGDSVSVDLAGHFSDPDGDALTYAATSSAPGVASVAVSGSVVTVTGVAKGTANVTVTASDPDGLSAEQAFEVTVPNRAPVATDSIPAQTVEVGDSVSVDLAGHFSDPDGDALTYAATSSAPGVASVAVSGSVVTVTGVAKGTASVTVTASDPDGLSAEQAFEVTVPNRTPVATDSIPAQTVEVGDSVSVDLAGHFSDPDGDALTYAATSSAPGVASVAVSGADVTVTGVSAGTASVTVTASDPDGLSAEQAFEVTVEPPNRDREALVALYNATDGPNWASNQGWLTDAPLGLWHGVTTDRSGNLTGLHLDFNGLTGSIPPELGDLANLAGLHLDFNGLTGSIPPELGDLANLTELDLSANDLTGSIPPELGDLANLTGLHLDFNGLTGSIPPELGDLANLAVLDLYVNELTGSIPPELGDLANLTELDLSGNELTGSIPPELGDLANLTELDLSANDLTGSIPRS